MDSTNQSSDKLDFVIEVLTSINDLEYDEKRRAYCGHVKEDSPLSFDIIHERMESLGFDTFDNDTKAKNLVFKITNTGAYRDIQQYISLSTRRLDEKPTSPIYIVNLNYKYEPDLDCNNQIFKNVLNIARLFSNLKSIADHTGTSNGVDPFVLFVGKDNLKINSVYDAEILNMSLDNVNLFIDQFILNEIHKEDRTLAVKNSLQEAYSDKDISLTEFLKKFDNFFKIVRNNFQMYMDKFSFEDFKQKIEEEKKDYLLKINKIFSDMQNQMLTLPIASVIAASQMNHIASFGDFIKNTALLIGVYIFAYMVKLFANNQKDSLDAIENEIEVKRNEICLKDNSDYRNDYIHICKVGLDRIYTIGSKIDSVIRLTGYILAIVTIVYLSRLFV